MLRFSIAVMQQNTARPASLSGAASAAAQINQVEKEVHNINKDKPTAKNQNAPEAEGVVEEKDEDEDKVDPRALEMVGKYVAYSGRGETFTVHILSDLATASRNSNSTKQYYNAGDLMFRFIKNEKHDKIWGIKPSKIIAMPSSKRIANAERFKVMDLKVLDADKDRHSAKIYKFVYETYKGKSRLASIKKRGLLEAAGSKVTSIKESCTSTTMLFAEHEKIGKQFSDNGQHS